MIFFLHIRQHIFLIEQHVLEDAAEISDAWSEKCFEPGSLLSSAGDDGLRLQLFSRIPRGDKTVTGEAYALFVPFMTCSERRQAPKAEDTSPEGGSG